MIDIQVGVLAAAGLQALDDFEGGMLAADHRRALRLGTAIDKIPGMYVCYVTAHTFEVCIYMLLLICFILMYIQDSRLT